MDDEPSLIRANPFTKAGHWFKGAVHFHTTASDGEVTPEDAVAFFKANGYAFACCGDHWRVTELTDPEGRLLLIPGCELDTWTDDTTGNTHIMCVGVNRGPGEFRPRTRPTHAEMWDMARAISEYRILAHPYWSTRSPEFIKSYPGLHAIEVYNHNFERTHAMGFADYCWHMLLNEGCRVDALAVDDAHLRQEFGRAWLMVRAAECTRPAIVRALADGDFYSTMGPQIESVVFAEGRVRVRTTPARRIVFRGTQFFGKLHTAPPGGVLTEADCAIDLQEMELVRVEVEDHEGRKAWSNPFHFGNCRLRPPSAERTIHIT